MKKIIYLQLLLFCLFSFASLQSASAQVVTGSIAVIAFNSDETVDRMTIVTLANIASGTTTYITDRFWDNNSSAFITSNTTDGAITWTTTSAIAAGTIISFTIAPLVPLGPPATVTGLPGTVTVSGWTTGVTASAGDNWFIFRGTNESTPTTWIFGWANWSSPTIPTYTWLANGSTTTGTTSNLPPALTDNTNAIALTGSTIATPTPQNPHFDNMYYTGPTTGSPVSLLTAICTDANWTGNEDTPPNITPSGGNFPASFTLTTLCTVNISFAQQTNATCGMANGSVTASAFGGSSPYTYLWSNGRIIPANTGLLGGVYSLTVTDQSGCTVSQSVNILGGTPNTTISSQTNASCGANNGSATVSVIGGVPSTFDYSWSNGLPFSPTVTGLAAGTYSCTVTELNSLCSSIQSVTITSTGVNATIASQTNTTCGLNNGSATASASGGTTPYTYQWNNGRTTAANTGLAAGTYSCTVTDQAACSATQSVIITASSGVTTTISSFINTTCGSNNGSATALGTGGLTPYSYLWSNGRTTANNTGLLAGTYTCTISDLNGCPSAAGVTITSNPGVTATISSFINTTCGSSNGSATALGTGGLTPYSYLWSNGRTTANNTGLLADTYTCTITDFNGCPSAAGVTITSNPGVTATISSFTNTTCGSNNGSATASGTGGATPYSYLWNNGRTTANNTGLFAGTYICTITDMNACSSAIGVTVTSNPGVVASISSFTNTTCGSNNGSATASGTGGATPYSYLWNNGRTTANNTGLFAGTYTCTITDMNACSSSAGVTITSNSGVTASISSFTNTTCGSNNGSATASGTGGATPYSYLWNNGRTTANNTGLFAGTYTCTITDMNACSSAAGVTITSNPGVTATISSFINTSCGSNNGSATASGTGGATPYLYLWSNGRTTANNTGLLAGTYTCTITDFNACTSSAGVTITSSSGITASIASQTPIICGPSDGSATVAAQGGTPTYTYQWSNGRTTAANTGLSAGTYTCTITDQAACSATQSVTISAGSSITASIAAQTNTTCGLNNGSATVSVQGGTAPYSFAWSTGQATSAITAMLPGIATCTVTDNLGCSTTTSASIAPSSALSAPTVTPSTAITLSSGQYTVLTANGSGGTLTWHNSTNAQVGTGASFTTPTITVNGTQYYVKETSAGGCVSPNATVIFTTTTTTGVPRRK